MLEPLQDRIRSAIQANNSAEFLSASVDVLRWGGVFAHNGRTLDRLGEDAIRQFSSAATQLEPTTADTDRIDLVEFMNAGWTKVYSLMIDDFPIYDGRVGASLGYLARLFCEETNRSAIPTELRFAWGRAKGAYNDPRKNRNPSKGGLKLPALHAAVRQHTRFNELPEGQRVRGLEAALFMVGYELPSAI